MFRKGLILLLAALTALSVGWSAAAEEIAVPEVTVRKYEIPDNEALRMIRDMYSPVITDEQLIGWYQDGLTGGEDHEDE